MDTTEVIVYLSIAILVGGLVIFAIGRFGDGKVYEGIKSIFEKPETTEFTKVDETTLPPLLFTLWEECGLGTEDRDLTFQYTGATTIGRTEIFSEIKRLRLCNTFSSVIEDCGKREDLDLTVSLETNSIYKARCDASSSLLVVE